MYIFNFYRKLETARIKTLYLPHSLKISELPEDEEIGKGISQKKYIIS